MVTKRWIILAFSLCATANEAEGLQKRCLACHRANQIPDTIIYRRYLQTYSASHRIAEAMKRYITQPDRHRSIMPPQFFYKFPMKPSKAYDPNTLDADIEAYIRRFDIRKRLRLSKPEETP